MSFLGRQVAKYAYRKIAYSLKDYLTNPAPISVQDKDTAFMLAKPTKVDGRNQIGLVIIGDIDESIIPEIELDLTAGVAAGHIMGLERHRERKFKADNLVILENTYQEHEFKHREVGAFGAAIGQGISKEKYMRKEIMKTTKVKGMDWGESFNDMIPKVKAKKYSGTPIIKFYEKLVTKGDWVIPIEAVRIWQHVKFYSGEEANELGITLKSAFQSNNEDELKQISKKIESYVKSEDKKKRKK